MVEYKTKLDALFQSLADPTRRDILEHLIATELSISEIAHSYKRRMSLAAVSKHIGVLENAGLVTKRRYGKQQIVALSPPALEDLSSYLEQYQDIWERRLDRLETYLEQGNTKKRKK